tara:strand:+ start:95061 stop:95630 length:570 start_codon:yes stop_codon:yes gene_type:complete
MPDNAKPEIRKNSIPKGFDRLKSDFARAALNLPVPDDLSNHKNQKRWALYVGALSLRQLVDQFAQGLDGLDACIEHAPYVFDFTACPEGQKAKAYSYILGCSVLAQQISQRLAHIYGADDTHGKARPSAFMHKACAILIDFDDDDAAARERWVNRYAKAGLLDQNTSLQSLESALGALPKLFKLMAKFI